MTRLYHKMEMECIRQLLTWWFGSDVRPCSITSAGQSVSADLIFIRRVWTDTAGHVNILLCWRRKSGNKGDVCLVVQTSLNHIHPQDTVWMQRRGPQNGNGRRRWGREGWTRYTLWSWTLDNKTTYSIKSVKITRFCANKQMWMLSIPTMDRQ